MRSFRLAAFIRNSISVVLPLFACLGAASPAFALRLISSTALNMPEPNAYDFASGIYRAPGGDIYVTGIVNNWDTTQDVIARYTPDLVLVASGTAPSSTGVVVDPAGSVYAVTNLLEGGLAVTKLSSELAFLASTTVSGSIISYPKMALGPDGDIYISGVSGNMGCLFKFSPLLVMVSSVAVNSGGYDEVCDIAVDVSGSVFAVTGTGFGDGKGVVLSKYDAALGLQSSEALHLHGAAGHSFYGNGLDIAVSHTGDVFVGGETIPVMLFNGFLAKFSSAGTFISSATIVSFDGTIQGVTPAGDGGAYVTGSAPTGVVVAKVSSALVIESSAAYKDFEAYYNVGRGIVSDGSGSVYVAGNFATRIGGEVNSDLWLGKFNSALDYISSATINGEEPDSDTHLDSVTLGPDGSVYVSGGGDYLNGGLIAKYSPHLVRISSVTGFNSGELIYMDADASGNLYFRTEEQSGNDSSSRAVYKYDQELQFMSSTPFSGDFSFAGRIREISGSIFLSGEDADPMTILPNTWKYSPDLVLLSSAPFPGPNGFTDIAADEEGNLYSVGMGLPPGGGLALGVLLKQTPDLVLISSVNFSSTTSIMAVAVSTRAQSVYLGGIELSGGWMAKFDYDLNLISSMTIPIIPDGWPNTRVNRIVVGPDQNLIAVGACQNSLWLARISPDLVIISSMTIDLPENVFDEGTSIAVSKSGDIYVAGGSGPSSINYLRKAWLGWFTYVDEVLAQQGMSAGVPAFTEVSTFSLSAVWNSTYAANTFYYVQISTAPDFVPVLASSSTYNKTAVFSGLAVNTTYYGRVYDQLIGDFVDLGFTSTLTRPPAFLSLDSVWSSSAAISWEPNGNPDWTKYVIGLWDGEVSSATLAVVSTTGAVVVLPEGTTGYISVRSINNDGVFMEIYPLIGFTTLPATGTAVQTGMDKTVLYNGPSGDITASIPAGAFDQSVSVTIKTPAAWNVPSPTAGLLALNSPVNLEVTLDKPLQPSRNVEIIVSYRDSDLGARDESKLVLARFDEPHAAWVPLPSTRDTVNNRITAVTRHFSLFQVMQVTPSATLTGVTVGPNPLKPSSNPGQSFTFRNLPADGRVSVYSYMGELLYEARADGAGMTVWDGRNKSGARVASGLYLALVQGAGDKKIMKLVIER